MTTIHPAPLAVGIPVALGIVGALWKLSQYRSDTIDRYRPRVALAQAGLDDKASTALRTLAEKTNEILGGLESHFDPLRALGDPATLRGLVADVDRLLREHQRLPRYYRSLQLIGPTLIVVLIPEFICVLVVLSYFSGWKDDRLPAYVCLWIGIGLVAIAAVVLAIHIYLSWRFSHAEALSESEATR